MTMMDVEMGGMSSEAGEGSSSMAAETPGASAAGERLASSRLVTQIMPDYGSGRIAHVKIVGRPKSPYSGTMGDHSTAFSVQTEAIKVRLQGKSSGEALAGMRELVEGTRRLPGARLVDRLPDAHRKQLDEENDRMSKLLDQIASTSSEGERLMHLQELVNAYLGYRELLPLSTINVRALSPALAGKGHGESGYASMLANYETDVNASTSTSDLGDAFEKLFDGEAVAKQVAQIDETAEKMAPGLDKSTSARERAELFVQQHLDDLKLKFPKAYDAVTSESGGEDAVKSRFVDTTLESALAAIDKEIESADKSIKNAEGNTTQAADILRGALGIPASPSPNRGMRSAGVPPFNIDDMRGLRDFAQGWPGAKAKYDRENFEQHLNDLEQHLSRKRDLEAARETLNTEVGAGASGGWSSVYDAKRSKKADSGPIQEESAEEEARRAEIASQIVLSSSGDRIASFWSSGRPRSPFSGTMGAHTTAWTVHVDAIRTAVEGKTVPEAIAALDEVKKHAFDVADRRAESGLFNFDNDRELDASGDVDMDAKTPRETLKEQRQQIQEFRGRIDSTHESDRAFMLQEYANLILTFINSTPGTTLESADTGGKGEGKHRRVLLDHDKHSKEELEEAISGLLDTDVVDSEEMRAHLMETHLEFIKAAYPDAFNKVTMDAADAVNSGPISTEVGSSSTPAARDKPRFLRRLFNKIKSGGGRSRSAGVGKKSSGIVKRSGKR